MPVFHSRHRVGPQKIAAFVAVGFVIGSVLGYIFMATVHAVGCSDAQLDVASWHAVILAYIHVDIHDCTRICQRR